MASNRRRKMNTSRNMANISIQNTVPAVITTTTRSLEPLKNFLAAQVTSRNFR